MKSKRYEICQVTVKHDMDGWIKIYRTLREHWIWSDPVKLKWWIDILLTVNHAATKVNIGYQLYDCGRGQSVQSIGSWAKQWGTSKDTARNFLTLLEKDGMITREPLGKTTRLTVCNYESYQYGLHDTPPIHQQENQRSPTDGSPIAHTNKNDKKNKNVKNEKKIEYADDVTLTSEEYKKLCDKYSEEDTKGIIELLSNFKGQNGKKYKSDYKAILNWGADAYYERKIKSNQRQQKEIQFEKENSDNSCISKFCTGTTL